jgi:transcriptional regulator with XRE-family HTH domain
MDLATNAPFAGALREARLAAGLTQEALAERAGVSVRGIQSLERGLSRPRWDTARRPVTALRLEGAARASPGRG